MSNGLTKPIIRLNTDVQRSDPTSTPPREPTAYSPWSPLSPANWSIPNSPFPPDESIIQPGVIVQDPPSPLEGMLTKIERIGNKEFSELHQGIWSRSNTDLVPVAIRHIRRFQLRNRPDFQAYVEQRIKREAALWLNFKHENILPFYGYTVVDGDPFLISSWCANGNLTTFLHHHPELTESKKLELLRGAARGLEHLHTADPPIVHGDIRPENIMITENFTAVLRDFGLSTVMSSLGKGVNLVSWGQQTAAGYQAKELYGEDSLPTPMSDVYAFGGVTLATMSGKAPFHQLSDRPRAVIVLKIYNNVMPHPGDHPKLISTDPLWNLLQRCWDPTPEKRPSITEIVSEISALLSRPVASYMLSPQLEGELKAEKLVGRGGYAYVYRGSWIRPGNTPIPVAIKCIQKAHLGDGSDPEVAWKQFEKRITRETVIWGDARHSNILPFYGYKIVDGETMLVSPWCENGSLTSYIRHHPELSPCERLKLLRGAARGLAYLHTHEPPIVHGDIKPDNILVTSDIEAVLCDFGVSRLIMTFGRSGLTTSGQGTGSPGYQAKEMYQDDSPSTSASDVYAFGGVILAVMSGKPPFYKKRPEGAVIAINNDQTPMPNDHPELPKADPLWKLLKKCWDSEPSRRPSMGCIVDEINAEVERRSASSLFADAHRLEV